MGAVGEDVPFNPPSLNFATASLIVPDAPLITWIPAADNA
jgi:hypothetical protein